MDDKKQVESEALAQIMQILCHLDKDGPVYTAFTGCMDDAEMNLVMDTRCSMADRNTSLTEENGQISAERDELQKRLAAMGNNLALFAGKLSEEKEKTDQARAEASVLPEVRGKLAGMLRGLEGTIVELSGQAVCSRGREHDRVMLLLETLFKERDALKEIAALLDSNNPAEP